MTPNELPRALIAQLPLFCAVNPEWIDAIAASSRERRLSKGEIIFRRGDSVHGFFIVMSGQIKLAITSPQGSEKVVEIISPRQSFGEAVMFLKRPYPVFAEALQDSVVLHIPSQSVFNLLEQDIGFSRAMLAGLSVRLHSLIQDVENYSLRSSTQRVIGYLLQQIPEEYVNHDAETHAISLPTSKQVIASRLNLTPETLSRVFSVLTQSGLIEVQGKNITILDIQRFSNFD